MLPQYAAPIRGGTNGKCETASKKGTHHQRDLVGKMVYACRSVTASASAHQFDTAKILHKVKDCCHFCVGVMYSMCSHFAPRLSSWEKCIRHPSMSSIIQASAIIVPLLLRPAQHIPTSLCYREEKTTVKTLPNASIFAVQIRQSLCRTANFHDSKSKRYAHPSSSHLTSNHTSRRPG